MKTAKEWANELIDLERSADDSPLHFLTRYQKVELIQQIQRDALLHSATFVTNETEWSKIQKEASCLCAPTPK